MTKTEIHCDGCGRQLEHWEPHRITWETHQNVSAHAATLMGMDYTGTFDFCKSCYRLVKDGIQHTINNIKGASQ